MVYKDDSPIVCEHCGETVYPPHYYYKYNNSLYCSQSCLCEILMDEHSDDISKEQLMSAEDHEYNHADMKYNEQF